MQLDLVTAAVDSDSLSLEQEREVNNLITALQRLENDLSGYVGLPFWPGRRLKADSSIRATISLVTGLLTKDGDLLSIKGFSEIGGCARHGASKGCHGDGRLFGAA